MFVSKRKSLHHKGRLRKVGKVMGVLLGILLILGVITYFVIVRPVQEIQAEGVKVAAAATTMKESFKKNDIDLLQSQLSDFKKTYASFQKTSEKIYWTANIPILGGYTKDFRNGVEAGNELIGAGELAINAIAPHADLIGFKKGEASFVEKPADERIATAVMTLDQIVGQVDEIAKKVDNAEKKVEQIDPNRYPKSLAGKNVRNKILSAKTQFQSVATFFVDAQPLIRKLPSILGANDEEKIYLVLFQNNAELRPTGGFWTAYAVFKVQNGKFRVERSEDMYSLDESISSHPKAPPEILMYHKGVSTFNIRDANISPDFVESVDLFNSLYDKSSHKIEYDGIFAVDTNVLVDILSILGPTEASGIVFKSDIDERCDCPQVIYALLNEIDRPVGYIKENRKGLLGDLLYVIMQKALGFSPSQYWGKLSQVFIEDLEKKDILIYLKDEEAQKAIEALNYGGRIRAFEGDYLHISDTNFAGAKSNLFVEDEIESVTEIGSDGTVQRTVTIDYKNPYRASNCNLEAGQLCLNATLRNWLRIYVPEGSTLVDFKGSEMKVRTYDDLGKTVFEGFMTVKPQGKATVVVTYTLPFKVNSEKDYSLLIQKQPGAKNHITTVKVNGNVRDEFELSQDTIIATQ